MKKLGMITAATALLVIAGTSVYAQPYNATPRSSAQQERMNNRAANWPERHAEMQRVAEARIAGVPAGLKLTAEQQKLWQPVEAALKSNMKSRSEFMAKMYQARKDAAEQPDFLQRLEMRSEMSQVMAQNSKTLFDAAKPFWASLDDGQKKLLPQLVNFHEMGKGMAGKGRGHKGGMMGMGMNGPHHGNGPRQGNPSTTN